MPDRVLNDHVIRFATFELDLRTGELRKNGLKLRFGGQPLQVLSILLEQPGAVVTREEMQKRLWPDTFVDVDHNLNTAINKIREVLEEMNRVIQKMAKESEACQRLTEIPGVGPVTATALISAVGNGSTFQKGRNLAAWMGIVPGEYSTGGKQKLLGISKRGHKYLRRLFVQGVRSVLQQRHKQAPRLSTWLAQLLGRTHQNVVVVALANKLVRMAWAVLCKNQRYCAPVLAVSA